MSLIGLECGVRGELNINRSITELSNTVGEVVNHGHGGAFLLHLKERLVLPFQDEDVGDTSEGDSEMDDLGLCNFIRDVSDMHNLNK